MLYYNETEYIPFLLLMSLLLLFLFLLIVCFCYLVFNCFSYVISAGSNLVTTFVTVVSICVPCCVTCAVASDLRVWWGMRQEIMRKVWPIQAASLRSPSCVSKLLWSIGWSTELCEQRCSNATTSLLWLGSYSRDIQHCYYTAAMLKLFTSTLFLHWY